MKIKTILLSIIFLSLAFSQQKEIIAYYSGYRQSDYLKKLEAIGSIDKLTMIDFAFSFPVPDSSGEIIPWFTHPYPIYQEIYSAEMSIDGIADTADQPLRGQFNQLLKLKTRHPNLKIMLSIGGWGGSTYFSDLALTSQSREKFVNSCIDIFIKGNLPVENNAGGKGSAKGLFDGFDIDWEFPVSGGPEGTHYNPNDIENMSALFKLFREKLDSINPNLLLTAAISARRWELWKYNFAEDQKYLDWFNVMTYDYHGIADSITGHHTNLLSSPDDPDPRKESFDHTIKYLLDTAKVRSDKIVPGAAFYGKTWANVDSIHYGLYQPAKIDPEKHNVRFVSFNNFSELLDEGYQIHWDDLAMAPWLYNPLTKIFCTYDDVRSISLKSRYVDAYSLRGIMFWSINGDDSLGTLVSTIYKRDLPNSKSTISKEKNISPSISLIKLENNNKLVEGSNLIIRTNSEDTEGKVAKVEFYVDGKSIGYNTIAPFDWVWFNIKSGDHEIKAVSLDNNGGKKVSAPLKIKVINKN